MNKNRYIDNRAFTLIEIVVVAVLLGILAAVAIPAYNGYLRDSRQRAVDELAQSAAAAADGYYRKTKIAPYLADLNLHFDQNKFTVVVDSPEVVVQMIGYDNTEKRIRFSR